MGSEQNMLNVVFWKPAIENQNPSYDPDKWAARKETSFQAWKGNPRASLRHTVPHPSSSQGCSFLGLLPCPLASLFLSSTRVPLQSSDVLDIETHGE